MGHCGTGEEGEVDTFACERERGEGGEKGDTVAKGMHAWDECGDVERPSDLRLNPSCL